MSGIAGIISNEKVDADIVVDMVDAMNKRGPVGSGIWRSRNYKCLFGHTKLSTVNTDTNQPLTILDEKYALVFDGKIYNYKELKDSLKNKVPHLIQIAMQK